MTEAEWLTCDDPRGPFILPNWYNPLYPHFRARRPSDFWWRLTRRDFLGSAPPIALL